MINKIHSANKSMYFELSGFSLYPKKIAPFCSGLSVKEEPNDEGSYIITNVDNKEITIEKGE